MSDIKKKGSKKSVKMLEAEIARLTTVLHELNKKYQFKHVPGRPLLLVQIGDPVTGWIGNAETVAFLIRELKQAHADSKYNVLIYHYAARFNVIGGSNE